MRERKGQAEWSKDTEELRRRDQVIISKNRTASTRATLSYILQKHDNPECPFCYTGLQKSIFYEHVGEPEQKHRELNINKDEWKKGRVEILKLIDYLKKFLHFIYIILFLFLLFVTNIPL
jgi:hypothetical protein